MKRFILKTTYFIAPIFLFVIIGIFMPTTPKASTSLLMANIQKDSLLASVDSPRIIFIGGSNLSFGLNSQVIKDSLNLNPINTAIHAGIGLKFMIDNTLGYIRKGDIVVVIPEYDHFYNDFNDGSEELLRIILDTRRYEKLNLLNKYQIRNIASYVPKYVISKIHIKEYLTFFYQKNAEEVYLVDSFNKYGDTYAHWNKKNENFESGFVKGDFNEEVLIGIKEFEKEIEKKGAALYVSYPCYEKNAFLKSIQKISKIKEEYNKYNLKVLGTPERYMMDASFMFNTIYHLNKIGVEIRTQKLLEDIKNITTD